ncbi:hypothetical protein [Deinococcus sonorensis]|uniref:ZU5 domain-containing protein n=2 Tax=Deinococcus sonorensis TaxID=309891 RepID=A0AAU7U4V4_9DEIO
MTVKHTTPLLAALLLSTLAACGHNAVQPSHQPTPTGTPTGEALHLTVGPEGGTAHSADGRLTVTIPAGALTAPTDVTVQPISSTTPHGKGAAYRLGPEGTTFRQPVALTFRYDEAQESGATGFVVASQDGKGVWQAHLDTLQDREANTLSVQTNHFSDWSWAEAYRLDPQQAAVRVGQSVNLTLVSCTGPDIETGELVAPLVTTCAPYTLTPFTRNWAVNGTAGGSASSGSVRKDEGDVARGTYTAPARKPSVNPVAVSVDLVHGPTGKNTLRLVANVNVIGDSGPCTEVLEGLYKCVYRLTKWNGHDLPYNLPNTSPYGGDSRDRLTGGYLQLNASQEGLVLGTGTYEVRYEFDHDAGGQGHQEHHVLNDVGKYHTNLEGTVTTFESVGKVTYTGDIRDEAAQVEKFPMATPTFSGDVKLDFVP